MRTLALWGQRLRRDWVQLLLWTVGTAALAYAAYIGVDQSYGNEQDRVVLLATVMANPVILLFRGLPSGAGDGAFITFLIFPWLAILASFMSSFLAVRHTRTEEETGRMELVSATPASRWRPAAATILHGTAANLVLAVLTALAFLAVGLPADGAWLVGIAAGAVGLVFLGVGLVAAQLMRTSRGANSVSVAVLITTFLLAGIGNAAGTPSDDLQSMQSSWLTWLSPFGWGENTRGFDQNDWPPVALCAGAAVVLVAAALVLQAVRDVGASLVPERHGRTDAGPLLSSTTGLVWRLTYPSIIGWAIAGILAGLLATSLSSVVEQMGGDNPAVAKVLESISGEGDLAQGVLVTFFVMLGIFASCAAVQTVARARQEEAHGTAEIVLAQPVPRVRWLADFVVVGFVAVLVVVASGIAGAAIGTAAAGAEASLVRDAVVSGAGQVLAASVFLVLTALVFVLVPRATIPAGWSLVMLAAIIGLFGPLFQFPDAVTDASPFSVAPIPIGDSVDWRGVWWLILAIALGAAGSLALMRRRELATGG
jgi:ABC-2 type transport system permease protein